MQFSKFTLLALSALVLECMAEGKRVCPPDYKTIGSGCKAAGTSARACAEGDHKKV
ncbi:hypothetical protein PRZ48_004605 [Zasmidium cellare]|uniref:Uncharacterized protein n=1 Tax=Zasmidium cellare TaxID=395010 RepID=A0ABR0EQC1_ZASCE|nr:hypothetical protein PRZ48_004605 [Zasmidium cellare]